MTEGADINDPRAVESLQRRLTHYENLLKRAAQVCQDAVGWYESEEGRLPGDPTPRWVYEAQKFHVYHE